MLLRILGVFFILSINVNIYAEELVVNSKRYNYTLNYSLKTISLKGYLINLNLSKTKCNEPLLSNFYSKMRHLLKTKVLIKDKTPNSFKFRFDGDSYYVSYKSKLGVSILSIPREIQRIKIEEKYKCKGKMQ